MSRFKFRAVDKSTNAILKVVKICESIYGDCEVPYIECVNLSDDETVNGTEINWIPYGEYKLLQCTGIKDINKKYIYEGDICKVKYCDIEGNPYDLALEREVKWSGAGFRLYERTNTGELSSSLTTRDIYSLEVIGNIYEGVKDGLS